MFLSHQSNLPAPLPVVTAQVRSSLLFWDWRVLVSLGGLDAEVASGSCLTHQEAENRARRARAHVFVGTTLPTGVRDLVSDRYRWDDVW